MYRAQNERDTGARNVSTLQYEKDRNGQHSSLNTYGVNQVGVNHNLNNKSSIPSINQAGSALGSYPANMNSQRELIEMVNNHGGLQKNRSNNNLNNYSPSQTSGRRNNYGPADYKQNLSNRKNIPGPSSYPHRQMKNGNPQKYSLNPVDGPNNRVQNASAMVGSINRYNKQQQIYNSSNPGSNNMVNSLNINAAPDIQNMKRMNNVQLPGLNPSGSTERINYSQRAAQ